MVSKEYNIDEVELDMAMSQFLNNPNSFSDEELEYLKAKAHKYNYTNVVEFLECF